MKKIIFLATAMVCFLTIEAQEITKILGKVNTSPVYLDLKTDTIAYTTPIRNLQINFGFEYTNGNTPLSKDDTIIIKGKIGTTEFPERNDEDEKAYFVYVLPTPLASGGKTEIKLDNSNGVAAEQMVNYSNILDSYVENDSTHRPSICGILIHVSKYPVISDSSECVTATFSRKQQTPTDPIDAIVESAIAKVKLFPNPVNSELSISNLKNTNVEVYNVVGQRISHFEDVSGELSIEMKTFPDGIYFVKMQNGKTVRTEKIKLVK